MVLKQHKKFFIQSLAIMAIIFFYDNLIDLLLLVVHFLFELLHYLFEIIEQILDLTIEHIFHTDPHITEIIVFYILFLGGIFIFIKSKKTVSLQFKKSINQIYIFYYKKKEMLLMCSQNLFLLKNIRRYSIIMMCLSLVVSLIFS